jgi:hypothetical protein
MRFENRAGHVVPEPPPPSEAEDSEDLLPE